MVYQTIGYHCETCNRAYRDHDKAHRCEIEHITQETISMFGERLREIMERDLPENPRVARFRMRRTARRERGGCISPQERFV